MPKRRQHCYEFPRPSVTVDVVLITTERRPRVLLIRRKAEPFAGRWALPGGFVDEGETLEAAARRELKEEAGLRIGRMTQLMAAGDPGRDPRGWTVSIVFLARVNPRRKKPRAADDAAEAAWHFVDDPPVLAFDHADILKAARRQLARRR
jgi:8-oxo-dGTP diphosphatase